MVLAACVVILSVLGHRQDVRTGPSSTGAPVAAASAVQSGSRHPTLVAHAGGAVYGYRLTNAREALDQAYLSGFRYIELDFSLTTDAQIVLIHDWEGCAQRLLGSPGRRSLADFTSARPMAGLHLMTLDDLLQWLRAHPDCSVITDTKEEDNASFLQQLLSQAGDQSASFIPQAYSYDEFTMLRSLGCERVILSLYKMDPDFSALPQFAQEQKPWAVTLPEAYAEQGLLTALSQTGTAVYAHTVDSVDFYDEWKDAGLTGIYTNYFSPARWLY